MKFLISLILIPLLAFSQIQIKKKDLIALYGLEKGTILYNELKDYTTYNTTDAFSGSLYSIISGIGLGFTESKNFGYKWDAIPNNTWLKQWYLKNTSGDGIFSKSFDFNKVSRAVDYTFDRLATKRIERFYGDNWYSPILVYAHLFVIKNTSATIVRNWTKYNQPFKDFEGWTFDLEYIINRLFIEN